MPKTLTTLAEPRRARCDYREVTVGLDFNAWPLIKTMNHEWRYKVTDLLYSKKEKKEKKEWMEMFSRLGEQSTASPWLFFSFLFLLLCTKRLYYYYFGQKLVIDHCSHMMERVPAAADHLKALGHLICQRMLFVAAHTEEKMCLSPNNRRYFRF